MGNSQSNSINGEINKILQETLDESSVKNESPLDLKFTRDEKPKSAYVSAETDDRRSIAQLTPSKTAPRKSKNKNSRRMSPRSRDSRMARNMQRRSMSPTSSQPVPRGMVEHSATSKMSTSRMSTSPTSSEPVPAGVITNSVTSTDSNKYGYKPSVANSVTSSASVPQGMVEYSATSNNSATSTDQGPLGPISNSATSSDVPRVSTTPPAKKPAGLGLFSKLDQPNVIRLNSSIMETSESEPLRVGGYTYAAEASEIDYPNKSIDTNYHGGNVNNKIITLDRSVFETSENEFDPPTANVEKKNDFDPEKFFKEMQTGGIYEPRNKEYKKSSIEKYLDTNEDDSEGFDFAESTEGLDVNSNEDTEDLKAKVKHLRMMVARSKGKKSSKKSSKKSHRKAKRMTESSGGASESGTNESASQNSVSEYLDTTSSISTSDVRLISMNKMRK
jgi:hypothetical protein